MTGPARRAPRPPVLVGGHTARHHREAARGVRRDGDHGAASACFGDRGATDRKGGRHA